MSDIQVTQVAPNVVVVHPDDIQAFIDEVNRQAAEAECQQCQAVEEAALDFLIPADEVEQAEAWLASVSQLAAALDGDYETAITVATALERSARVNETRSTIAACLAPGDVLADGREVLAVSDVAPNRVVAVFVGGERFSFHYDATVEVRA